MKSTPLSVYCVSLGCPKNTVDTEKLLGSLGCSVKLAATPGRARLIFINTCSFIEPAVKESIRAILDAIEYNRKLKKPPLLVVAGCLPGRYDPAELAMELPEVNLWLQPKTFSSWPDQIRSLLKLTGDSPSERLLSTPPSYAWLKISDGCNHKCSFCAIPDIRGQHKSQHADAILAEAAYLLGAGVRELILVGQDVSAWGSDNGSEMPFLKLLQHLAKLDSLVWLRLLYLYPGAITKEFLKGFKAIGKPLLPYFDIPFQHCSKDILRKMGRPFMTEPQAIIERIRQEIPEAALRTTLITGFPGETEAQFEEMAEFITRARFNNLGIFMYQAEEGTIAAQMPDQIPQSVKEERYNVLMRLQADISAEILAENVGKRLDVLVDQDLENEWSGLHKGRVWFQAPEIDGVTYISGPGVSPGSMIAADIEESSIYDLTALA